MSWKRSKHRGQNDGWLKIEFDTLTLTASRRHPFAGGLFRRAMKNNQVKSGGIGALLGSVVGALIDNKKGALIGAAVGAGGGLPQAAAPSDPGGSLRPSASTTP
jgi:hypothetical protein